ncbi:MAG: anaerobic ribonucleoside-triphosphate reductase activating protein [Patescibacteria group bacterium]|jgi:pyruvate formate lyase activating enzyme
MIISGLQKTTLIDYPDKIAAIVFTRGCNFRCGYCHNPELVNPEIFYPEIKEDEIISFLEKRRKVLDGVVITGGEPLIHSDIEKFIRKVKALGYAVKLDTNGTNPQLLKDLIDKKLIDYIAMDIKHSLDKYHHVTPTSPPIKDIKKSIKIIMTSGLPYEFRTTVLPRHFKKEDFINIGELIKGARIYYLQQFRPIKTLDKTYAEEGSFTEEELSEFKKFLTDYVDKCEIRGII